jgi:hypothetical protein
MEHRLPLLTWSIAPKYILLGVLLLSLLSLLYFSVPYGLDWQHTYRPAALAIVQGKSPYSVSIYYAAPWAAWMLIPIAVLPSIMGRMVLFLLGLASYMCIVYRLGTKSFSAIIFLCSPAVIGCLINGNIEWLALLGAALPPQIGLILLAIKPQVGIGLGMYWFVTIWREQGLKKLLWTFAPVGTVLTLSFLMYGWWPLRFSQTISWSTANDSLFPYGVILGCGMLIEALRKRDMKAALASGPLLSPYVLSFTWAATLVYLLKKPKLLIVAVIALWIPDFLKLIP